jgi:hypothetical protein
MPLRSSDVPMVMSKILLLDSLQWPTYCGLKFRLMATYESIKMVPRSVCLEARIKSNSWGGWLSLWKRGSNPSFWVSLLPSAAFTSTLARLFFRKFFRVANTRHRRLRPTFVELDRPCRPFFINKDKRRVGGATSSPFPLSPAYGRPAYVWFSRDWHWTSETMIRLFFHH